MITKEKIKGIQRKFKASKMNQNEIALKKQRMKKDLKIFKLAIKEYFYSNLYTPEDGVKAIWALMDSYIIRLKEDIDISEELFEYIDKQEEIIKELLKQLKKIEK